jgi:cytochrome c-type biogenesis protein CcmF
VVPIAGAGLHDPALTNVARSTALAQMAFVLASFGPLVALHVTSDFSVANVYENSHSLKPLIYKVTGVWEDHEGSMLLWVLILALFGGLVAAFGNNLPLSLRAHVLATQAWIVAAFYFFILTTSNPFLRIANPPIEGRDLNPVLLDIGLAVHPPLLYLGYVGFSISFSFRRGADRGSHRCRLRPLGAALDAGGLDLSHARDRDGILLGLLRTRLGWLVVLGSG